MQAFPGITDMNRIVFLEKIIYFTTKWHGFGNMNGYGMLFHVKEWEGKNIKNS